MGAHPHKWIPAVLRQWIISSSSLKNTLFWNKSTCMHTTVAQVLIGLNNRSWVRYVVDAERSERRGSQTTATLLTPRDPSERSSHSACSPGWDVNAMQHAVYDVACMERSMHDKVQIMQMTPRVFAVWHKPHICSSIALAFCVSKLSPCSHVLKCLLQTNKQTKSSPCYYPHFFLSNSLFWIKRTWIISRNSSMSL